MALVIIVANGLGLCATAMTFMGGTIWCATPRATLQVSRVISYDHSGDKAFRYIPDIGNHNRGKPPIAGYHNFGCQSSGPEAGRLASLFDKAWA